MLNNMDINQEGQLSSEDRLFMGSSPRYQTDAAQPSPFGGVSWEGGRPVYSAVGQNMIEPVVSDIFSPQQHQQQQCHLQQLSELQQQQLSQEQQALMFQQQLHQQQQDVLQQQQQMMHHQQHHLQMDSQ